MAENERRKPDFVIRAMNKETGEKNIRVGVGWSNTNGTIYLSFNRFIVPPTDPVWVYTLFPNDYERQS